MWYNHFHYIPLIEYFAVSVSTLKPFANVSSFPVTVDILVCNCILTEKGLLLNIQSRIPVSKEYYMKDHYYLNQQI